MKADLCFCDPPYNVDYACGVGAEKAGKGRRIKNDALGEGFGQFLYEACVLINVHTNGAVYICMSSSELHTLQAAFSAAGGHWSTFIIWAKNRFTLGQSDYQRQYEPILYGWPEGMKRRWCGARNQSDVWLIDRPVKNDLHPTMKPISLVERAIRNSSRKGDLVFDPFGGSVTADGAYDTRKCHEAIAARGAHAVIPPRKNAKPWKPTSAGAIARNEAVSAQQYLGRTLLRRWSGYHRRSRVETKMHCMKLLGQSLMARDFDR